VNRLNPTVIHQFFADRMCNHQEQDPFHNSEGLPPLFATGDAFQYGDSQRVAEYLTCLLKAQAMLSLIRTILGFIPFESMPVTPIVYLQIRNESTTLATPNRQIVSQCLAQALVPRFTGASSLQRWASTHPLRPPPRNTSAGNWKRSLNRFICVSVSFRFPARNMDTALSVPNWGIKSRCVNC